MSRDRSERARGRDLELEASPEGYAAACQAALRDGDPERARAYLSGALGEYPRSPELLEIALTLSPGDPWPSYGGLGGRRSGPFPGPERGVQSWRWELPSSPGWEPVVDARGGAWAYARTSLVRLDRSGLSDSVEAPPGPGFLSLESGRPHWFDPALGALSQRPAWAYVRSPSGLLVAWKGDQLEGTGGTDLGWRRRVSNLWRVAVGRRVFVVLSSSSMSGLDVEVADLHTGAALGPSRSLEADFQASWYRVASVPRLDRERFLISTGKRVGLYDERLTAIWERALPEVKFACDGRQVVFAGEGGLQSLDLESGQKRWALPGLDVYGSPALDGRGWVYVISGGSLLCFDSRGERRLRVELGSLGPLGSPVLGGPGELYLSAGNSMVCVV